LSLREPNMGQVQSTESFCCGTRDGTEGKEQRQFIPPRTATTNQGRGIPAFDSDMQPVAYRGEAIPWGPEAEGIRKAAEWAARVPAPPKAYRNPDENAAPDHQDRGILPKSTSSTRVNAFQLKDVRNKVLVAVTDQQRLFLKNLKETEMKAKRPDGEWRDPKELEAEKWTPSGNQRAVEDMRRVMTRDAGRVVQCTRCALMPVQCFHWRRLAAASWAQTRCYQCYAANFVMHGEVIILPDKLVLFAEYAILF